MVRALVWTGAFVCLLGVGACKESKGSGPVPRSELASRLAGIACNSAAECCRTSGRPFDKDGCVRAYGAELSENIEEIENSRVDYDAAAAGDCLDAVAETIVCGDIEDTESASCERVFVGKVPPGQPCEDSSECQRQNGERATCTSVGEGGVAVCTPLLRASHGKLNEACGITCYEGSTCLLYTSPSSSEPSLRVGCYRDEGLFCGSGTCQSLADIGGACSGADGCKTGSFCDFQTRSCAATKPNGAVCSASQECQSGRCSTEDGSGASTIEPGALHCMPDDAVDDDLCTANFDDDDSSSP